MQDRRIRRRGSDRIHNGGQRAIAHFDQFKGVFGAIAVGSDDHRDGLSDVAHPADRDRPAFERRLHADHETRCQRFHVVAGEHRGHAIGRARGAAIDGFNVRMGVQGTQDGGGERAGARP